MKLLNLWPQEQVVAHPQKRLFLEMVLALLAVVVLLLSAWMWLNWRTDNVKNANQMLKNELVELNKSRTVELSSGTEMPRVMRQLLIGQLDWMGELPQWLMDERVRWISAKFDVGGLKLQGVALDGEAMNAMLDQVKSRYPNPPVRVSEMANVSDSGKSMWRFEMHIEMHSLLNKVESVVSPAMPESNAMQNDTTPLGNKPTVEGRHE